MPTIQELREKRGVAVKAARDIADKAKADKGREMNADEQRQFDAHMEESDTLKAEVDRLIVESRDRRLTDAERELTTPGERRTAPTRPGDAIRARSGTTEGNPTGQNTTERQTPAEMRWRLHNGEDRVIEMRGRRASEEYRRAFRTYLLNGSTRGLDHAAPRIDDGENREGADLDGDEFRDLVADSQPDGGYLLAPMQMVGGIIKAVDNAVVVRQFATIHQLNSAQNLGEVTLDNDPSDADWTTEILTGSDDSTMSFGRRELNPTPFAKRIKISRKLLRAASMGVEAFVMARMAYKMGVTEEKAFLTGSGANQPLGLFTASANGISTGRDVSTDATTTNTSADHLIEIKHTLKGAYWGAARWLMHRDLLKKIRKLKDTTNQYLWQPGLTGGIPDTILDSPYVLSEYAPNTFTTGLYVCIYGDLSYYHIAESLAMEMQRLNELYAESNKVGFIGRAEVDAMPVLEEAFVRGKLG